MKKAVNIYISLNDTFEKLDAIKKAGYDGVMLTNYVKPESADIQTQINYCKKIGLEISMVHCRYNGKILKELWEAHSEVGDEIVNDLINQVNTINGFGIKNFVIHAIGDDEAENTIYGLKRIEKLLAVCEKYKINLCIENLFSDSQIKYIFDNIKSPYLKFCYDSGHENFLTPNANLAVKHSSVLATTHLHDNHGKTDEHLILGLGTIDQDKLAKALAKANLEFLTAEIKFRGQVLTHEELLQKLKLNLEALNKLENKIKKYQK